MRAAKALSVLAILASLGLTVPEASAKGCSPVITPGEDIARVAAKCQGPKTFTIMDGSYRISSPINAESGDVFRGVFSDGSRPTINANGSRMVFEVGRTNRVRISALDISGARGGNYCAPGCGQGIGGNGRNLHVAYVRIHHNVNQGIGNPGDGFVLENSEIDHNGSYAFTAMDRTSRSEPSSAAGIKIRSSGTFRNNNIHDNYWNGLWCDDKGGPISVTGNTFRNNGKTGIQYETCAGGSVIKNNIIERNGYVKPGYRMARAGVLLQDPRGLHLSSNIVRHHPGHGIYAVKGNRQPIASVKILENNLTNDTLKGCHLAGIYCRGNN